MDDEEFSFERQRKLLEKVDVLGFEEQLKQNNLYPLKPKEINSLDISLTYKCDQKCRHCHVMSSPSRKEMMSKDIMAEAVDTVREYDIGTVELTGGSPELHPNFTWFIDRLGQTDAEIVLRTNLTAIKTNEKPILDILTKNRVTINASLHSINKKNLKTKKDQEIYDKSIEMLKKLNQIGYGKENLELNLVYNPSDYNLPQNEKTLEKQYKKKLREKDIDFNNLFTLTNMPIGRFLREIKNRDKLDDYMNLLIDNFNPDTVKNVMCRELVSVAPNGRLYDCGFNQALKKPIKPKKVDKITKFNEKELINRKINLGNHCYGCTAKKGSSCFRTQKNPKNTKPQ
ncbi:MAG: Radical SAM superfamily enzyme [Candidatus Methanohalarchaeum thermophilum]|uniref:Radical SAM superfamily enzyme n=1 Tax=Methanohalarchaeum thermophilum TaxID=1903181 RepID=A0A1Q6DT37_METT1|nr:MAG: Radical SAM superfamily enzyme [Candidatus Methanohalarchaeum thermophilum]